MSQTLSRQQRRRLERQSLKTAPKPRIQKGCISVRRYYEGEYRQYFIESQVDLASYRFEPTNEAPLAIWTHRRSETSACLDLHGHDIAISIATQPED